MTTYEINPINFVNNTSFRFTVVEEKKHVEITTITYLTIIDGKYRIVENTVTRPYVKVDGDNVVEANTMQILSRYKGEYSFNVSISANLLTHAYSMLVRSSSMAGKM